MNPINFNHRPSFRGAFSIINYFNNNTPETLRQTLKQYVAENMKTEKIYPNSDADAIFAPDKNDIDIAAFLISKGIDFTYVTAEDDDLRSKSAGWLFPGQYH